MPISSHAPLELSPGPIQSYFTPWSGKREKIDAAMLRHYERLYERRRRAGNIRRFGLSIPMMTLFGQLYMDFSMFAGMSALLLGAAIIGSRVPDVPGKKTFFAVMVAACFTLNVLLLIMSVTRDLIRTIKAI